MSRIMLGCPVPIGGATGTGGVGAARGGAAAVRAGAADVARAVRGAGLLCQVQATLQKKQKKQQQ